MKTIEEKAKAYDEAFERAKQIRNGNPSSGTAIVVCEQIFPELAESEDERIRKWLVVYFGSIKEEVWIHRDITCEQILGWLEKQKESLHIEKTCKENADSFTSEQKEQKDYRKLYEDISKSEWFKKAYVGKSLGTDDEQKPAEWSEEEQQIISFAADWLTRMLERTDVPEAKRDIESVILGLKSLRPSWKPTAEQIGMVTRVCNGLHMQNSFDAEGMDVLLKQLGKIYWNTPDTEQEEHWNPTQEQMEALLVAIHCTPSDENMLISLYNDLKKL